jgi:hypothetical protein
LFSKQYRKKHLPQGAKQGLEKPVEDEKSENEKVWDSLEKAEWTNV